MCKLLVQLHSYWLADLLKAAAVPLVLLLPATTQKNMQPLELSSIRCTALSGRGVSCTVLLKPEMCLGNLACMT